MNLKKILILIAATSLLAACSKNSPTGTTPDTTKSPVNTDTVAYVKWGNILRDTTIFNGGAQVAAITNADVSNASGMGASRSYPGMLWIENDHNPSGNNDVYLFDTIGTERANFSVTGATDRDWTDMSIGPGPDSGTTYFYLADIGNSNAVNEDSYIFRFPEPSTPLDPNQEISGATAPVDKISFIYPNGPRDAETILVDPQSKDIYIFDKYSLANVYYLPYPQSTDTVITAQEIIANMPFDGAIRSGGIAPNRSEIIVKSYTSIYRFTINAGQSILSALTMNTPVSIPYLGEYQGEAMCYTPDGNAFWTTSKFNPSNYADLDRYIRR
jgi:hypothetical protein